MGANRVRQTAALLFSEYICLAIMSFPWTYSVLGILPGLILTIFVAVCVQYTSLTIWYVTLLTPGVSADREQEVLPA
jgi:hypothetical protein